MQDLNEKLKFESELPNDQDVIIVQKSFEHIRPLGIEFSSKVFQTLFEIEPKIKAIFAAHRMKGVERMLMQALILVVDNLDQPEKLQVILQDLGHRHVGYGVIPAYYEKLEISILTNLRLRLDSNNWNDEIENAWMKTFRLISDLMLTGAERHKLEKKASARSFLERTGSLILEKANLPVAIPSRSPKTLEKEKSTRFERSPSTKFEKSPSVKFDSSKPDSSFGKPQTSLKPAVEITTSVFAVIKETLVELFFSAPDWMIITGALVLYFPLSLAFEENSLPGRIINEAQDISLFLGLVIYLKEAPARRRNFHYQAFGAIDHAGSSKVSAARIMALEDLNNDSVSLKGFDGSGKSFDGCNLANVEFSHSVFKGSTFNKSQMDHARFNYADLEKCEALESSFENASFNFSKAIGAKFNGSKFPNATFLCADLTNADFTGADLQGADLESAILHGTFFAGADLTGAKVKDADLANAILYHTILPDGSTSA